MIAYVADSSNSTTTATSNRSYGTGDEINDFLDSISNSGNLEYDYYPDLRPPDNPKPDDPRFQKPKRIRAGSISRRKEKALVLGATRPALLRITRREKEAS